MLPLPDRKTVPNHKADHFLLHMLKEFLHYWKPGSNLVADEQDAGFKGKYPDKQRVTFKGGGNEFLISAICDDGFTITFYFRNMLAIRK